MRDLETTEIALQAAETGHLVCSTLHTLGAADTINRIIDMYPERQHSQVRSQICGVLEAVVSQQLMPRADGKGYAVAYEIMFKNKKIQHMIRDKNIDAIADYIDTEEAAKEGMISMDNTIYKLFTQNVITKDTALDFAFDRKVMTTRVHKFINMQKQKGQVKH